jgi:hypothetical protein
MEKFQKKFCFSFPKNGITFRVTISQMHFLEGSHSQGCQMVYFQTKNTKFRSVMQKKDVGKC